LWFSPLWSPPPGAKSIFKYKCFAAKKITRMYN
jgi:hypothetical protein